MYVYIYIYIYIYIMVWRRFLFSLGFSFLFNHPSSDGVTIKMPYGVDVFN